jgi:(p)ppGpp synthase/HD superfamily hydrolase
MPLKKLDKPKERSLENPRLQLAIAVATKAHAGQTDKAGMPYMDHPRRVAEQLKDNDLKIIAYLHDVVEDTEITLTDVQEMFGSEIAVEVEALTKRENEPYAAFIQRVAPRQRARKVKIADLKDNLDLKRLVRITQKDRDRAEKYKQALEVLEHFEDEESKEKKNGA